MIKMNKCKTCKYHGYIGCGYCMDMICQYILVTGHMRGCPVGDDCIKYEKGKRAKTKVFNFRLHL